MRSVTMTSPFRRAAARLIVLVAAIVGILTGAGPARAHEVGLSRGEYGVTGAVVTATLTFARRDVAHALRRPLGDDAATAVELERAKPVVQAIFAKGLVVRGDGAACVSGIADASPFETDAVRIVVHATCAAAPHTVAVEASFLASLPFGHRHLVRAPGEAADRPLTLSKRTFAFAAEGATKPATAPLSLLGMGLEHILRGYDHLVFLLGLVIVGGAARQMLVVVTAFTVGHSISLALATLGVFVPNARFVEPLIALSIVYVGVENLARKDRRGRWILTLLFGLVHGFGFAEALRELALPRAELPAALALFNVGVELGQLAVLAVALPLVWIAQRRPWFRDRVAKAVNVAIAIAGAAWFVARVWG